MNVLQDKDATGNRVPCIEACVVDTTQSMLPSNARFFALIVGGAAARPMTPHHDRFEICKSNRFSKNPSIPSNEAVKMFWPYP